MVTATATDPYEAAMETEYTPGPKTYFGQVTTDLYFCVLVKGVGKEVFDAEQHSQDNRRTSITIELSTLGNNPILIKRELIAESPEWGKFIKPSLKALNADLRSINGKWARAEMVPTGQRYISKQTGETKEKSTIKFLAIYGTEDECRAAAEAYWNSGGTSQQPAVPAQPTAAATVSAAPNPEKETAAKFLRALWQSSGNDIATFAEKIAKTAPVNKYFTIDSPEAVAAMAA